MIDANDWLPIITAPTTENEPFRAVGERYDHPQTVCWRNGRLVVTWNGDLFENPTHWQQLGCDPDGKPFDRGLMTAQRDRPWYDRKAD